MPNQCLERCKLLKQKEIFSALDAQQSARVKGVQLRILKAATESKIDKEGLELALTELVSGAPANEEKVRKTKITCASGSEWKTGNSMQASST